MQLLSKKVFILAIIIIATTLLFSAMEIKESYDEELGLYGSSIVLPKASRTVRTITRTTELDSLVSPINEYVIIDFGEVSVGTISNLTFTDTLVIMDKSRIVIDGSVTVEGQVIVYGGLTVPENSTLNVYNYVNVNSFGPVSDYDQFFKLQGTLRGHGTSTNKGGVWVWPNGEVIVDGGRIVNAYFGLYNCGGIIKMEHGIIDSCSHGIRWWRGEFENMTGDPAKHINITNITSYGLRLPYDINLGERSINNINFDNVNFAIYGHASQDSTVTISNKFNFYGVNATNTSLFLRNDNRYSKLYLKDCSAINRNTPSNLEAVLMNSGNIYVEDCHIVGYNIGFDLNGSLLVDPECIIEYSNIDSCTTGVYCTSSIIRLNENSFRENQTNIYSVNSVINATGKDGNNIFEATIVNINTNTEQLNINNGYNDFYNGNANPYFIYVDTSLTFGNCHNNYWENSTYSSSTDTGIDPYPNYVNNINDVFEPYCYSPYNVYRQENNCRFDIAQKEINDGNIEEGCRILRAILNDHLESEAGNRMLSLDILFSSMYKLGASSNDLLSFLDSVISDSTSESLTNNALRYKMDLYAEHRNYQQALTIADDLIDKSHNEESELIAIIDLQSLLLNMLHDGYTAPNTNYTSYIRQTTQEYLNDIYNNRQKLKGADSIIDDSPGDDFVESAKVILLGNYPNPFNPTTTIAFNLSNEDDVMISIFNIKGQMVKEFYSRSYPKGYNTVIWDGLGSNGLVVSSGVYFYSLKSSSGTYNKKMILMK